MKDSNDSKSTRGWDTYWTGARGAEAFTSGGVSHPGIASFWDDIFSEVLASHADARILDIATGSGAVIERLSKQPDIKLDHVTCVDISAAAINGVQDRFRGVIGVISDANSIPLESGRYDVVTSQFGIEYAGLAAIDEALRLVAPGGALLFLLHIQSGEIYKECAAALDAIRRTQQCQFVAHSLQMFEAGFAAVRGADRLPYEQAGTALNPAIQELESILNEHGEHVAGDTVARLYADVGRIHGRIQYYEPDEVLGWLRTMENELADYEQRMASMCEAALDDSTFAEICQNLGRSSFDIVRGEPLMLTGSDLPMAWVLRAIRRG